MQKLKNTIVDNMIKAHLTSKEVDFMLFISRYQDMNGRVGGVHYKHMCSEMGMSYQEFYNAKKTLQEKGFIRCEKNNWMDNDITILGNTLNECQKEGYINTNHNIFYEKSFYKLKAGAKLLAMFLMKVTRAGEGHFEIYVKNFYDTEKKNGYPEKFGVSVRVLHSYLMSLKEFFSIWVKDRKYFISPKKVLYRKTGETSEAERYRDYHIDVIARRLHLKEISKPARNEIQKYFMQYGKRITDAGRQISDTIEKAIAESIHFLKEQKKEISVNLNLKLIHSLLKISVLEMEKAI